MSNLPDDFEVTHTRRLFDRRKSSPPPPPKDELQIVGEDHDPRNHIGKTARLVWPTHCNGQLL